jgi:hypothetical protein
VELAELKPAIHHVGPVSIVFAACAILEQNAELHVGAIITPSMEGLEKQPRNDDAGYAAEYDQANPAEQSRLRSEAFQRREAVFEPFTNGHVLLHYAVDHLAVGEWVGSVTVKVIAARPFGPPRRPIGVVSPHDAMLHWRCRTGTPAGPARSQASLLAGFFPF